MLSLWANWLQLNSQLNSPGVSFWLYRTSQTDSHQTSVCLCSFECMQKSNWNPREIQRLPFVLVSVLVSVWVFFFFWGGGGGTGIIYLPQPYKNSSVSCDAVLGGILQMNKGKEFLLYPPLKKKMPIIKRRLFFLSLFHVILLYFVFQTYMYLNWFYFITTKPVTWFDLEPGPLTCKTSALPMHPARVSRQLRFSW